MNTSMWKYGSINMKTDKTTIERFRKNLPIFRKTVGWSGEHLSELLGVSRATIINIESKDGKMSVIQYLAIRALLNEEIVKNNDILLNKLLTLLVDGESDYGNFVREQAFFVINNCGTRLGSDVIKDEVRTAISQIM